MFSLRTGWDASPNALTTILGERREKGLEVIDLTTGNPTVCGFSYPEKAIIESISGKESLLYSPDPRGHLPARRAIADFYRPFLPSLDPRDIFLTASTSESYSLLFRLLCDPGDTVLFPKPSYPLFDFLAGVNDVEACHYRLAYDGRWMIDIASLRESIGGVPPGRLRAIVLVDPHNPTGMYVDSPSYREVAALASRHGAALIIDEVFFDYNSTGTPPTRRLQGIHPDILTFTLNGLSKMAALPQMKLGWILAAGPASLTGPAEERLEILCDTYLSVNTPVQAGLPGLLAIAPSLRDQIRRRIAENFATLVSLYPRRDGSGVLRTDGGWYATVRLPSGSVDEEFATGLLRARGVYLYPGYFFDFAGDDMAVVSLIVQEDVFRRGIEAVRDALEAKDRG